MRIVLLGGAGLMGRVAATDLVEQGVDEVIIADLNEAAAQDLAARLGGGARAARVDVTDGAALRALLAGADAVLNGVQYYFNLAVMEAALAARVPYVDLGGLFHMTRRQKAQHAAWAAAGLPAILGMGSSPGLPNVHARYLADRLARMEYIRIYDGIGPATGDTLAWGYSLDTILDEMIQPAQVFRDGAFVPLPSGSESELFAFDPPIGTVPQGLSLHSEVATLPHTFADKGVREVFFKINAFGFAPAVYDYLRGLVDLGLASTEPIRVGDQMVAPRQVLKALLAARPAPPPPPDDAQYEEIVTEVAGRETPDGPPVVYQVRSRCAPHRRWGLDAGAVITGVPLAIVGQWLAAGRFAGAAGVFAPEEIVPPEAFFAAAAARGVLTRVVRSMPLAG